MSLSYFNSDQQDEMRSLAELNPEQRCWCGWYRLGKCTNGCEEATMADRLKVTCNDCGGYPLNRVAK